MSTEFKGELPSSGFVKGLTQHERSGPTPPYIEWSKHIPYKGEPLTVTLSTPRIFDDENFDQVRSVLITIHREPSGFEVWVAVETPEVYSLRLEAAAFSRIIAPLISDFEVKDSNDHRGREALRFFYRAPKKPGRIFASEIDFANSEFNPAMFPSLEEGIKSLTDFTETIRQAAQNR